MPYIVNSIAPEVTPTTWQAEVTRSIERLMSEQRPFVIVLRGDGQGRVFVHGDGGAPAMVRLSTRGA